MSYIEDLSKLSNATVEDVIRISSKYVPDKYRVTPWKYPNLNHGVSLLEGEDALCAYMAAYGEMHMIKCRSVLRNLPFDRFSNLEVYDWGCGQGIGSICLAEMLRDRNKLHLLKKVTLVEPSEDALARAKFNVKVFTQGRARIIPINKFLPSTNSNDSNCISGISYDYQIVIHIFSNILDITNIDLIRLSQMLPKVGTEQYIICIGPKNAQSNRINLFAKIFAPSEYLSNIDSSNFGVTKTNNSFSCNAKVFKYTNQPLNAQTLHYVSTHITKTPVYDDYDIQLAKINGLIHSGAIEFVSTLKSLLNDDDLIYFDKNIDGDRIDIIILRPNTGILIIKVFDYDISYCEFKKDKYDHLQTNCLVSEEGEVTSPINVLKGIKDTLITLNLEYTSREVANNSAFWKNVKTIGFFPYNSTEEVNDFFNEVSHTNEKLVGKNVTRTKLITIFKELYFNQSNRSFLYACKQDFINIISPGWHSYREGKSFNLTRVQERLTNSIAQTKQKIKGIAGSGKTEVLIHRAINAQIRTGKEVLILTYNLSLRNYIRHRLSQVRADFSWDKFYITNYHQFIKSAANNLCVKLYFNSFDDTNLFSDVSCLTTKYDAIFIDEIQDYKPEWLSIINHYFLAENGELVVYGDPKQRIYNNCKIDTRGDIRIGVIPGSWNGNLESHLRFSNDQLTSLADQFAQEFLDADPIIQDTQQQISEQAISFVKLNDNSITLLMQQLLEIFANEKEVDITKDLVVLAETHELIRKFENEYKKHNPLSLIYSTSESQEQYDSILEKYYGDENNELFKENIKRIRRAKKLHFSMKKNCLKLSTIHSYKGWDAENVVLIIEPNLGNEFLTPQNIYTGITRARNRLFIISLGNSRYDSFFNQYNKAKPIVLDIEDIF